jgi:exopolysaccharide biosynthesis protein
MLHRLKSLLTAPVTVKSFVVLIIALLFATIFSYAIYQNLNAQQAIKQTQLRDAYEAHLKDLQRIKVEETNKILAEENKNLLSDASKAKIATIEEIQGLYKDVLAKIDRNGGVKISTTTVSDQKNNWGLKFLAEDYVSLKSDLTAASASLDQDYQKYLASLIKPAPAPAAPAYGFSYQTVTNSRGTFGVYLIKMFLSEVTIKTVTANDTDCLNNCPVKTLADFIGENNAYAGMNGTYLCPPDYASCAGKVNSYDFPVYNTNLAKWINPVALSWTSIGLATFIGKTPKYYRYNNLYNKSFVTAGISNFPILMLNGAVVDSEAEQTDYQKLKGTKGSIGTDGTYIYLALITNANVTDSAYVVQSLGERDALNLDGGGTSAMYINGSYKVGPGRYLPNAVLLVKN